jgi:hypothetical protein
MKGNGGNGFCAGREGRIIDLEKQRGGTHPKNLKKKKQNKKKKNTQREMKR